LPGEGPRAFALRAATELPAQGAAIKRFAELFEAQQYACANANPAPLRHALAAVRSALPWRFSRN
jgi:protein-glutamine gamma-glutamyltransferase